MARELQILQESLNYNEIVVDDNYGAAEGYETSTDSVQLENWLRKNGAHSKELVQYIKENHETVAFLNNINIDESNQGKGRGKSLMNNWLNEVDASIILLIADKHETQKANFNIVRFYESFGFEIKKNTTSGPLMISEDV